MSLASRTSLIAVVTIGLSGGGFVGTALAQNPHAAPKVASKIQTVAPPLMPRAQAIADMQADQKKLDELVAAMNAATGADKVDRIAAVVTELAARQSRMSARMMHMMGQGMMKMEPTSTVPQAPRAQPNEHDQHHPEY